MLHLPTLCPLPLGDSAWKRRRPERSVLYRIVQDSLLTFLDTRDGPSRAGLPRFIRREFLAYLDCGIPARGFLRVRCDGCRREQILPFSCKGRGFCPSCCHRRMLDQEAHITEEILPDLPIRQFVFTVPFALRYRMAFNPKLCSDVRRGVMRALFSFYRRQADKKNITPGPTGAITAIQRFGSALNLNVHFHILCFDGVFSGATSDGRQDFHYTGTPTKPEIERLLADCILRAERVLEKHGIGTDHATDDPSDEDPELAACLRQSVADRERVRRRGDPRPLPNSSPHVLLVGERGYTLHADTAIPGFDSDRRTMLVRYILRPPFAPSQIKLTGEGKVSFRLGRPWSDGTTHMVWTKEAFLSRLSALIPRPRKHLITYHGVLAPNHSLRQAVVRKPPNPKSCGHATSRRSAPRKRRSHENLLLRAYGFLFRRCDHCGGNKRVLAVINQDDVIQKILRALGLDPHPPQRAPPANNWHFA